MVLQDRGEGLASQLVFAAQAMLAYDKTWPDCDKNVSFAVAEGGQIVSRVSAFAEK